SPGSVVAKETVMRSLNGKALTNVALEKLSFGGGAAATRDTADAVSAATMRVARPSLKNLLELMGFLHPFARGAREESSDDLWARRNQRTKLRRLVECLRWADGLPAGGVGSPGGLERGRTARRRLFLPEPRRLAPGATGIKAFRDAGAGRESHASAVAHPYASLQAWCDWIQRFHATTSRTCVRCCSSTGNP